MVWKADDSQQWWCAEVDGDREVTSTMPWKLLKCCQTQMTSKHKDLELELWRINMDPLPDTLPSSLPADVCPHHLYLLLLCHHEHDEIENLQIRILPVMASIQASTCLKNRVLMKGLYRWKHFQKHHFSWYVDFTSHLMSAENYF